MTPQTTLEKHRRISTLPPTVLTTVIKMIAAGTSVRGTARWLQNGGHMKDVQLQSVIRAIERWMADNPELFILPRADSDAKGAVEPAEVGDEPEIDELEEIDKLIRLQWKRISIDQNYETQGSKLQPDLKDEIKLMGSLLVQRAEMKRKMGFYPIEGAGEPLVPPEVAPELSTAEVLDLALAGPDMHEIIEGEGRPLADGDDGVPVEADLEEQDQRDRLAYKMALRRGLVEAVGEGAVRVIGE